MQQENNHIARKLFEVTSITLIMNYPLLLIPLDRLRSQGIQRCVCIVFPYTVLQSLLLNHVYPFFFLVFVMFTINTCSKHLQKAVMASPKNRFAWHVWGIFEANLGNVDKGRKLLKIGHAVNPKDPVLLQSLALLEYKYGSANLARVLFRRAAELDPRHQPVWMVRIPFHVMQIYFTYTELDAISSSVPFVFKLETS